LNHIMICFVKCWTNIYFFYNFHFFHNQHVLNVNLFMLYLNINVEFHEQMLMQFLVLSIWDEFLQFVRCII
jgi:hypothetical protein